MSETNFKDFTEDEFQKYFINTLRSEGTSPTDIYGRQLADRELLNLTNPNKNATGGKGLDPFTQAVAGTVANRAIDYMINPKVSETTTTESTTSQIPQMPEQYDTSPYRAPDIIGAGIARRPTQESYFNQLEKVQNARLEDAYNRRTDTDEAKYLQSFVSKIYPRMPKELLEKISPYSFSTTSPMIASLAEKDYATTLKNQLDKEARENWKNMFPDTDPAEINSITDKNFEARLALKKKQLEKSEDKVEKEADRAKNLRDQMILASYKANLKGGGKGKGGKGEGGESGGPSNPNANLDKTLLRQMIDKESGSLGMIKALEQYHNYIQKKGFDPTSPTARAKYGDLIGIYKNAKGLGTLDSGVMKLFEEVLPNPNDLTTIARAKLSNNYKDEYLNIVKDITNQTYDSFNDNANIAGYTPSMLKQRPAWSMPPISQKTDKHEEGKFYSDGKGGFYQWMNGKAVPVSK